MKFDYLFKVDLQSWIQSKMPLFYYKNNNNKTLIGRPLQHVETASSVELWVIVVHGPQPSFLQEPAHESMAPFQSFQRE